MHTHKVIGAVYFLDDDDRMIGEVRGPAQVHAYAMAAAPELYALVEYLIDQPMSEVELRLPEIRARARDIILPIREKKAR